MARQGRETIPLHVRVAMAVAIEAHKYYLQYKCDAIGREFNLPLSGLLARLTPMSHVTTIEEDDHKICVTFHFGFRVNIVVTLVGSRDEKKYLHWTPTKVELKTKKGIAWHWGEKDILRLMGIS